MWWNSFYSPTDSVAVAALFTMAFVSVKLRNGFAQEVSPDVTQPNDSHV